MPSRNSGKNEKSARTNSCENLQQYCLNSSLHGLRYIGTSSLSAFERIFFGISFLLVVILATYFISNIYQKWNDSPVIISGNPFTTKIAEIPFPAVTICNMNQVKRSFAKTLEQKRDKVILDSICTVGDEIKDQSDVFEGKWSYVKQFLLNASQPCNQMIKMCKFGMRNVSCEKIFSTVLTDEGLCCTFNAYHPKLIFKNFEEKDYVDSDGVQEVDYATWTPEKGYADIEEKLPYPRPVQGAGAHFGLSILLDVDVANYYCSSTSSYGFKSLLHSPVETPKMANFGFFIAPGQETKVVITPRISEASDLIRNVPMLQRQCVFDNENNLSYYNIYSKKNCESECISKYMQHECNCTLYYMPRRFDIESKVCSRMEASCYESVTYRIQSTTNNDLTCSHCLPACFEINYGREISSCPLGTGSFQTVEPLLKTYNASYIKDNLAVVHISLNDNAYSGNTKNELIGFTEFLSNTGGLLGLFMGFSVISLMEIIYFLTLRPYCAGKRIEHENNIGRNRVNYQGFNRVKMFAHENYMKNERFQRKPLHLATHSTVGSYFSRFQSKTNSFLKNAKEKFTEFYKDEETQPPYPYFN
ncbi:hypothetical protein PVAND_013013 [Polypedilum vanderplanki]|uniref:Uncharacterized protein n=1 Tax=Polypedilum vanderplanki TaxID=319348 RepID=A0A9J6CPC1_POLVA|nr:hypothetical protein PVAND_013013 [Polypedilum vanderplanki]